MMYGRVMAVSCDWRGVMEEVGWNLGGWGGLMRVPGGGHLHQ